MPSSPPPSPPPSSARSRGAKSRACIRAACYVATPRDMVTFFFVCFFFSFALFFFLFFFCSFFFFFFFFFFFSFLRNCFCAIVTTHACGFRAVQRHGSSLAHGVAEECETREIYTYTRELPISLKRRAALRGTRAKRGRREHLMSI